LQRGGVEIRSRRDAESHIISIDDVVEVVRSRLAELKRGTERAGGE
jgi:hypothetical protein